MDYKARTAARYAAYYEKVFPVAFKNAHVGQTTEYVANKKAEKQAHYLTQRVMCQTDLYYLATEIFGMDKAVSAKPGMKGRHIWHPPAHGALCDELEKPTGSLIQFSRNMLKTTLAEIWAVQQVIIDPANVRIGMWSRSSAKVRAELKTIRGLLMNKRLVALFADRLTGNPKKFEVNNQDQLTVTRKVADESGGERQIPMDEAQIEVWGLDGTYVGRHYTHHYYDDIIDRDNTATASAIEKTQEQWGAIQAMKSPETIEKVVGTPWHQLDLYETIKKELMLPGYLEYKGVTSDWTIQYPYFTLEWLKAQETSMGGKGSYLFSCQYMLDTRPKGHRMFVLPVPYWTAETFPDDAKYYITVDPSIARTEKSNQTGIAVAAVSRSEPTAAFFVEADSHWLKPDEIATALVERIVKYQPEKVGIEYGLQFALHGLIEAKMSDAHKAGARFRNPEFVEYKTGGGGTAAMKKADKIDRTIGAMVRDGRAFFRPNMDHCFNQMAAFNPNIQKNEDDILDACGMMIQTIGHFHQSYWSGNKVKKLNKFAHPWRRTKTGAVRDRIFNEVA